MKTSLQTKKNMNCRAKRVIITAYIFVCEPSICFLKLTNKNKLELAKAQAIKIHCKTLSGIIQTTKAGMQQVIAYP